MVSISIGRSSKLDRSGGTLLGPLILSRDPQQPLEAATRQWVLANGGGIPPATVTAKGDLIAATGNAAVSRLGAGTDGQVLTAASGQATGLQWTTLPGSLPPSGTAGGDLSGSYPNPTLGSTANVESIIRANRLDQLAAPTAAVPMNGQKITGLANGALATDAAAVGQLPTALPPNGAATGDLAGSYPAPTVTATHLASPLPVGQGGTGQATAQGALNTLTGTQSAGTFVRSDGTNAALAAIQAADLPAATGSAQGALRLAGDLGGTASAPAVTKINGVAVTGTPASGQAPVATGAAAASWTAIPTSVNGATGAVTAAWPLVATAKVTANTTASANQIVPCDTTAGALTVTLPTAPADRSQVAIKHVVQGGSNAVTVACGGSDVFNKTGGGTSLSLPLANQGVLLEYSTALAGWYVLADDLPLGALDGRYVAASALPLPIGSGGTGQTSVGAAFNALSPIAGLGDLIYGSGASAASRLAGSTSASKRFLTQTGDGTNSAAPAWGTIAAGDLPRLDQITAPQAAVGLNSQKITSLANGSAASDAAAFGQIPLVGSAGTGAAVALSSTDATTTNARTPTAHASTHASGGSDPVTPDAIGAISAYWTDMLGLGLLTAPPTDAGFTATQTAGNLVCCLVSPPKTKTISTLGIQVTAAGVTGSGVNAIGLFTEAGVLIDQTGDMTTPFSSIGFAEGAMGASHQVVAGTNYYLVVLTHFSGTQPKFASTGTASTANIPLLNSHYVAIFKAAQASIPSSFTPSSFTLNTGHYIMYGR